MLGCIIVPRGESDNTGGAARKSSLSEFLVADRSAACVFIYTDEPGIAGFWLGANECFRREDAEAVIINQLGEHSPQPWVQLCRPYDICLR